MSVHLAFAERDLRALDRLAGEALLCPLFEDDRPPRGVAGLLDFRMGARLSRLCMSGFLTGRAGELVLMPGRPKIPFDKIVIAGLGPAEAFDEPSFERSLAAALRTLAGLQVRRAAIELPGRQSGAIDAQRALTALTSLLGARGEQPATLDAEALTVIDEPATQRVFGEVVRAFRARARR